MRKLLISLMFLGACSQDYPEIVTYTESHDLRIAKIGTSNGLCTASLIERDLVITAAHCVGDGGLATLYFGALKPNLEPYSNSVRKGTLVSQNKEFDIAYYRLDIPVELEPFKVIDSNVLLDYTAEEVEFTGWGCASFNDSQRPWVKAGTITMEQRFGNRLWLYAGFKVCQGDSGGPLFSKKRGAIIGVLSAFLNDDNCIQGWGDPNLVNVKNMLQNFLK